MKILYLFILFITLPQIAYAQLAGTDTAVGDSCVPFATGAARMVADSNFDLQDSIVICDGAIWQPLLQPSNIDISRINDFDKDTSVDTESSGWLYEYYDLAATPSSLATAGFTLNGGRDNNNAPTATGVTRDTNPVIFDGGSNYALKFTTQLTIYTAGTYSFRTTSDDGSQLFLDGALIVNNDGLHGPLAVTSAGQALSPGIYILEATFFEAGGGEVMDIAMSGPDTGNIFVNLENYNDKPADDDVIRFTSTTREVANLISSGAGNADTSFNLTANTPGTNTGIFFNEVGSNTAYVGLGYGSSSLNMDAIAAGGGIVFRQLGVERMRINSSGLVGVNQTSPLYSLDVNGSIRTSRIIDRDNSGPNIDFSMQDRFTITTDGTREYLDVDGINNILEIANTGNTTSPDETLIGNNNLIFVNHTNERVGIRTAGPRVKLDINGSLKLGMGVAACDPTIEGGLRWNSIDSCVQVCDGIAWECSLESGCADDLPDPWLFTDQVNLPINTIVESDIRQVTGTASCLVQIKATGNGNPQYRICSDSSCSVVDLTWTSLLGKVLDGKYVQMRAETSSGGSITHNISLRVGSRSETWEITTAGLCSQASPPLGTVCPDGTVYVGKTPDGFVKMFSQRCRNPRVWNGTSCVGTAYVMPWNNNLSAPIFDTLGARENFKGQKNTMDLVNADPNTDNFASYIAANYCNDLGDKGEAEAHGYSDWYLPSEDEADMMCAVVGRDGLNIDWDTIWTSNRRDDDEAFYERSDCWTGLRNVKWADYNVMCVRKESASGTDIVPDAFAFTDVTGAGLNTLITSSLISISGHDAGTFVSVSGSGNPEIYIDGRPWAASGTLLVGDQIQVRLTSAPTNSTLRSAIIDIGGVTSTWSVTTTP